MEGCCSPRGLGVQMVPASEGGRNGQSVGRMVPRRGPGMQLERWCPTPAITLQIDGAAGPPLHSCPTSRTRGWHEGRRSSSERCCQTHDACRRWTAA